jgi:hypothetical protein
MGSIEDERTSRESTEQEPDSGTAADLLEESGRTVPAELYETSREARESDVLIDTAEGIRRVFSKEGTAEGDRIVDDFESETLGYIRKLRAGLPGA